MTPPGQHGRDTSCFDNQCLQYIFGTESNRVHLLFHDQITNFAQKAVIFLVSDLLNNQTGLYVKST